MKKIIGIVLLLALLFALGCVRAEGKTTTLLVYMCGTDLQEDACEDLVEMAEVEAGDAINVVVLAGGAKEWDLEDLKGNSRTLAVIRDGYFEELQETRIIFPDPLHCSSPQFNLVNRFSGLIVGYSFPAYSKNVDIYLQEEMVGRLLLTEEGYSSYSQSSALSLTNKYTVRLYWLISSWRNKGGFVISLSNLKRILCLSEAYDRFDNVSLKIIEPARRELRARFPIWFEMRQYESGSDRQLAFKVKIAMTEEQRREEMRKAYDICFNILSSIGASMGAIGDIFSKVEFEDLRPFMAKLMDLVSYVRENRHIKDVNRYLLSSMDIWFADWLERYERIDQEEGQ